MLKLEIAETESFQKKLKEEPFRSLSSKIRQYVYPQLSQNPFFGNNIKKLKGEFKNLYRWRIGNFRLFYLIDEKKIIMVMIDVIHRKDSYR